MVPSQEVIPLVLEEILQSGHLDHCFTPASSCSRHGAPEIIRAHRTDWSLSQQGEGWGQVAKFVPDTHCQQPQWEGRADARFCVPGIRAGSLESMLVADFKLRSQDEPLVYTSNGTELGMKTLEDMTAVVRGCRQTSIYRTNTPSKFRIFAI